MIERLLVEIFDGTFDVPRLLMGSELWIRVLTTTRISLTESITRSTRAMAHGEP